MLDAMLDVMARRKGLSPDNRARTRLNLGGRMALE
jgi:hypothetical protein